MRARDDLYLIFALCRQRGRFVYEVAPWIFPQGFLTDDEIAGWGAFIEMEAERRPQ